MSILKISYIMIGFGLSILILWAYVFGIKFICNDTYGRWEAFDQTKWLLIIGIFLLALGCTFIYLTGNAVII